MNVPSITGCDTPSTNPKCSIDSFGSSAVAFRHRQESAFDAIDALPRLHVVSNASTRAATAAVKSSGVSA